MNPRVRMIKGEEEKYVPEAGVAGQMKDGWIVPAEVAEVPEVPEADLTPSPSPEGEGEAVKPVRKRKKVG